MALSTAALIALIACAALTPVAILVSRRTGLLDHPGDLKVQDTPIPIFGGVAVFAALSVPVAMTHPTFLIPLLGALALGTIDDLRGLAPRLRIGLEVVLGLVVGAVVAPDRPIAWLAAVGGTVLLINAINLLDGIDALAATVSALSCLGFAVMLHGDARILAGSLGGALVGFLLWNRPPARIYLGDGGSYLIGVTLALLTTIAWADPHATSAGWGAVILVVVPVTDTVVAIVRRARAGRPLFVGDRSHIYDQLIAGGCTVGTATLRIAAVQAVLAKVGIKASELSAPNAVLLSLGVVVVVLGGSLLAFTRTPETEPAR